MKHFRRVIIKQIGKTVPVFLQERPEPFLGSEAGFLLMVQGYHWNRDGMKPASAFASSAAFLLRCIKSLGVFSPTTVLASK